MKPALFLLMLCTTALGDFSSDAFPQSLDILLRLISETERSKTDFLTPHINPNDGRPTAYYVRSAFYVGQCEAAFGTVHILALNYTRSAPKDSRSSPRGHSFVLFFDRDLKLRASWRVDFDSSTLSLRDGSKLFVGDSVAFDYADLPKPTKLPDEDSPRSRVVIDGDIFGIPTWSTTK